MPTPTVDVSGIVDATIASASKWLTPYNNLKTFIADLTAGNAGAPVERLLWGTQSASISGTTISGITKKYVIVDTDGSAAQNLATISGPVQGHEVILEMANAGRVVTVKHGTGNIFLWGGQDVVLAVGKALHLFRTSTGWSDVYIPQAFPTMATIINTPRTGMGANAGTQTIGSIPATYKHLLLMIEARTDIAGASDSLILRFNTDATAANYYSQYAIESAASVAAAEILGVTTTGAFLPNAAVGSTGSAGNGAALVWIFNYASTTLRRQIIAECGAMAGITTGLIKAGRSKCFWTNTSAAINSITFLPSGGSNLLANTAYTLYGFN